MQSRWKMKVGCSCVGLLVLMGSIGRAQEIIAKPESLHGLWGDQGNGRYVNPVLPADYSDLDVTKVGENYYAISSTFQFSPGMVILQSRDLVNWTTAGHAVANIAAIAPEMNWDHMDRYGRGIWAGAIRYHDGKFWVYFGTPDEGYFVTTAKDAAGPWEPVHAVLREKGWDDCCPFWDDDGTGYLVGTHFADGYKIHLFRMTADGREVVRESDRVIHQSRGSEANKLYKINGWYYHYFSEVHGEGRVAMMERAKSLDGPWEQKQLNHVNKKLDKEPNQGGLLEVSPGKWMFLSHQGTGSWEGRTMVLLPVTWIDGWPIIGKVGSDGIGNMVWEGAKPIESVAAGLGELNDEFAASTLGPVWEWNYQPRAEKWSLTEQPGFLRLHAFKPLATNDVMKAGNTLTQRAMGTSSNEVTVKMEIGGMADGEMAGLCHFAKGFSAMGVLQSGGVRRMALNDNKKITEGAVITGGTIWLRSSWDELGVSHYAYSADGTTFTPFGDKRQLTWGSYRGDRIGIFNYNNSGEQGVVDVDWFHYTVATPHDVKK
jgi:beta-xylosidase